MKKQIFGGILSLLIVSGSVEAQESTSSIEEERAKGLAEIGAEQIPNPDQIKAMAQTLFAKPLDQQGNDELEKVAALANAMANLIGYLYDEYDSYYRENYRYDFVTKKVQPALD